MDNELGPVDFMVVAFPGNKFKGEIAPALGRLVEDGETVAFEIMDLDPEVSEALEQIGVEVSGLLNEEDLELAAEALDPNSSALMLVWENLWAREVAQASRDAGGEVIEFNRVPHEVVTAAREWALANAGASE